MRKLSAIALVVLLIAGDAVAQQAPCALNSGPCSPDLTGYALASTIPTPGAAAPPAETVGGTPGSTATQFAMANHTHPRITRSTVVTTDASGNFVVAWQTALSAAPTIDLTWVNLGTQPITCELTADPTTTAVQGRCKTAQTTTLSLSIVTAGAAVAPFVSSPAGVKVHVLLDWVGSGRIDPY